MAQVLVQFDLFLNHLGKRFLRIEVVVVYLLILVLLKDLYLTTLTLKLREPINLKLLIKTLLSIEIVIRVLIPN